MVVKLCIDCKYYNSVGNKCMKFRYFDIVSGKTKHYNANITRYSDNMCSREGKFFLENDIVMRDNIENSKTGECVILCGQDSCAFINPGVEDCLEVRYDASVEIDEEEI